VLLAAAAMSVEEVTRTVSEGQLVSCLTGADEFAWDGLPVHARALLEEIGVGRASWKKLVEQLAQTSLGWL
jgi:hypothetical protein